MIENTKRIKLVSIDLTDEGWVVVLMLGGMGGKETFKVTIWFPLPVFKP